MRARVEFEKQQESDRLAFRQQQLSLQQEGGQSKRLRLDNFDALALENSREVRVLLTLTHNMSCCYLFRKKKKKKKKAKKTSWIRKVRV